MARHCIKFEYSGVKDDLSLQLAFSKRLIDERKEWLTRFMESRTSTAHNYLYQKDTKKISFTQFVNKELVLFSNLDNERSIPSLVDGLKPGQRKVLFACFKRNLQKEIKVVQLAGSVAELSAYHHGEQSLMGTIINLAQNFVGSNNLNLLLPIGQFGTRLHGGKDAASPRYIFTNLSPLTRLLFNPKDDPLFDYQNDDGFRVEPEHYCPIIPLVLVNGAEGIGTGWSVKIPNYSVRDLIENLRRMLRKEEPLNMTPFYKNFLGTIEKVDETRFLMSGEITILDRDSKGDYSVEINELPIGVWTQVYKESVLELFLNGDAAKNISASILDYKEYHTDITVKFIVKMSKSQFQQANDQGGLHKFFKLQKTLSVNNMVLFDARRCLRRYESPVEILREFFPVRLEYYRKRKEYLENMMGAESAKLNNIARFIVEKIEGKIKVENLKKSDLVKLLASKGYDSDPVKKWKAKLKHEKGYLDEDEEDIGDEEENDFNYLLSMPIWNLTYEKKEEIIKQQKEKAKELSAIKAKSLEQLWLDDLNEFESELAKFEVKEKEDSTSGQKKGSKPTKGTAKPSVKVEYLPSSEGERVVPKPDETLVAKLEKDAQQKTALKQCKEDAKTISIVEVINSDKKLSEEELKQLNEMAMNLASPTKTVKPKPAATPKKAKEENKEATKDQKTEETKEKKNEAKSEETNGQKKGAAKTAKKKPEKLTIGSDSEESFVDDLTDIENGERRRSGRARNSVKIVFSDDGGDDDEDVEVEENRVVMKKGDDSDEDGDISVVGNSSSIEERKVPVTPVKRTNTKAKKKAQDEESDVDVLDLDSDLEPEKKKTKSAAPKKEAANKPAKKETPKKATPKKETPKKSTSKKETPKKSTSPVKKRAPATKSKSKSVLASDDDDDDDSESEKNAKTSKRKVADDDSDFSLD